jgi:hypothetical protein
MIAPVLNFDSLRQYGNPQSGILSSCFATFLMPFLTPIILFLHALQHRRITFFLEVGRVVISDGSLVDLHSGQKSAILRFQLGRPGGSFGLRLAVEAQLSLPGLSDLDDGDIFGFNVVVAGAAELGVGDTH